MLSELYAHQEWADALIWNTIGDVAPDFDSFVVARLRHILTVQRAFLSAWTKAAFSPQAEEEVAFGGLPEVSRAYHAQARAFVAALGPGDLQQPVIVPWHRTLEAHFGRTLAAPTLRDTIVQVAMHSAYHRGQVNTRLRELGKEPPLTDFIAWVWFGKPHAPWGSVKS